MASVGAIPGLRILAGETRNAASVIDGAQALPDVQPAAFVPVAFRSVSEGARRAPPRTLAGSHQVAEQETADAFARSDGHAPQALASNPFMAQLFAQEQPTSSRGDNRPTAIHPERAYAAYQKVLESPLLAAARAGDQVISTSGSSFDLEA